ncbi:hypothetical protein C1645_826774 [Glomus cerebriforme]|uniref:C2H2-type domain-containing protein n=1 Tax=Glomus cerebriforme TaxID=658196 RepID=A0A397SQ95_9GLOM|nr:hypothetical protein C1645_826774 [Glomus cerebriforme]
MEKGKCTCDKCGKGFATPRKLHDHQKRKFQCKLSAQSQDPTPEIELAQPYPEQLQELTSEVTSALTQALHFSLSILGPERPIGKEVVSEAVSVIEQPALLECLEEVKITDEMIQESICQQGWVNPNAQRPKEQYEVRLHDLLMIDPNLARPLTDLKKEVEKLCELRTKWLARPSSNSTILQRKAPQTDTESEVDPKAGLDPATQVKKKISIYYNDKLPYIPQLFAEAHLQITEILEHELVIRRQINQL